MNINFLFCLQNPPTVVYFPLIFNNISFVLDEHLHANSINGVLSLIFCALKQSSKELLCPSWISRASV